MIGLVATGCGKDHAKRDPSPVLSGSAGPVSSGASARALAASAGALDASPPEPLRRELDLAAVPAVLRQAYPSIGGFCTEFLAWAKVRAPAEIEEHKYWNDSPPVAELVCKEVPVPVLRNAASPWIGVKGVRLAWAYNHATWLFAMTAGGTSWTPIYFDDQYGNPMGCGPIWSRGPLVGLRVESGWLVATIDGPGPSTYYEQDDHSETAYQRGVAMCRMAGSGLRCVELNPQYERSLATKMLRSTGTRRQSPETVAWERVEDFHVNARGEISRLPIP